MNNFNAGKTKGMEFWRNDKDFRRSVMDFILEKPFDDRAGVRYEYGRLFAASGGTFNDPETFNQAVRDNVFAQRRP